MNGTFAGTNPAAGETTKYNKGSMNGTFAGT